MKRNSKIVVCAGLLGSLIVACSTSHSKRGIASFGDDGGWNKGIPWGGGEHPDGWGGQFDRNIYNGPEGFTDHFIPDDCARIVGNGPGHASRKHTQRAVANATPSHGPQHPQPPVPQPQHPQPQPQQPPAPQPQQPQQPQFNAAAAIQSCQAGRMEAINQARRATRWIGMSQGFMAAFEDGRREGMVEADASKFAQGYQVWVNQANSDARTRGLQIGNGEGSNAGSSDAVALFQNSVTPSGAPVPAYRPQQVFNSNYPGIQSGWTDTGHATPDYSAIMQEWLNGNIGSLNLPDAFGDDDHVRYGAPMLDRDHFRDYWKDNGYWTSGYTYHVDRSDWDDDNDGWNFFSHASQDPYFVQGYRQNYRRAAQFWFQVAFYQGANRGNPHDQGLNAGRFVQETYQERMGEMSGFNFAYARDSANGYHTGYSNGYQGGYRTTYDDYSSQPKVTFNLLALSSNLGNFVSGADVTANIGIVNYGGKDAQVKITSGSLDLTSSGSDGYSFSLSALQRTSKTTTTLGKVPGGFVDGQSDSIAISVQQIFGGNTTSLGSQSMSEVLDSWAEFKSVSWGAPYDSVLQGKANLQITVQNPLGFTTPGNVDVVARTNGKEVGRLHLGQFGGKASSDQVLSVSGLDPITCLSGGTAINLQLEMSAAGDTSTVTSKSGANVGYSVDESAGITRQFTNRSYMGATYFEGLVSSGASADQVKAAGAMIASFADDEIEVVNDNDKNLWGNSETAQGTIVAQLGYAYVRHSNKSGDYIAAYEALGDALIQKSAGKNIQPHGLFGKWNNRDGFRNTVKIFAPSVQFPD